MAPSKFKSGQRTTGRQKLVVVLAVLVALSLTLGPSLILNAALKFLPELGGLKVNYSIAEAGFLFNTITIMDLEISPDKNAPWRITAEAVRFKGLSFINTIKLLSNPRSRPPTTLFLAQDLYLQNLTVTGNFSQKQELSLYQATFQNLAWRGNETSPNILPMVFTKMDLYDVEAQGGSVELSLGEFSLNELGADLLGLKLKDLTFKNATNQTELNCKSLALREVGTEDFIGILQGTIIPAPWWIISALPYLELSEGSYSKNGQELLYLSTALFDGASPTGHGTPVFSHHRSIKFQTNSEQVADWLHLDFSSNQNQGLGKFLGPQFAGELTMNWNYKKIPNGEFRLVRAALSLTHLGKLELSGSLSGAKKLNPHLDSNQLLFSTMKWKLTDLNLAYQDYGLTQKIYDLLENTTFTNQPSRDTAQKIIKQYLNPWLESLPTEAPPGVFLTIKEELEAYLTQPASFKITIAPPRPLLLITLVNMNIDDIIKKIGLSIQINKRPPLPVTTTLKAVPLGNPIATKIPQPLNDLFTDENL